ncbi:MAG: hypothetical protein QHJ34_00645 [bacterium]|jgi:hypothetical protein|nr:hypothetical protein [candidate division KSB1 bacterium]MDH7558726.1 hypothetical protein [bacterium]
MTVRNLRSAILFLVIGACVALGSLIATEPTQALADSAVRAAQLESQAGSGVQTRLLSTQGMEQWARPAYRPFVATFSLVVQVVATLATAFFIFVVLLKREEE